MSDRATTSVAGRMTGRERLGWAGLVVVLCAAAWRAVSPAEPFPWWESDPFLFAPPIVGLTPTWALLLDVVMLIGAAMVVGTRREGVGTWACLLMCVGLGVIGFHAARDIETASAGGDLAAMIACGFAVWAASALPGARRAVTGAVLGFAVLMALVGAQQVFVEHPRTVASFELTRDAFYEARGWRAGGAEAAMYEERLRQAEPTGWFGLSNVYASFVGAGAVGLLMLAWGRRGRKGVGISLLCFGALAGAALLLTGSKGGIGAAALSAVVVSVAWQSGRAWVGRAVLGAAMLVVLAVFGRGLIGSDLGERSLLFRSQYQRGTMTVWQESPLVGAGPGQFQAAYTRLKPAGAPEDVTSPHSIGFDLVGVLGLGGLAVVGAGVIGFSRRVEVEQNPPGHDRMVIRVAVGVAMVGLVGAAIMSRVVLTPEAIGALLLGGVGWAVVAGMVARSDAGVRLAALGAGAVALIHGQLDVTAVWAPSSAMWGVLVGLGLGCVGRIGQGKTGRRLGCICLLGLSVLFGWRAIGVFRWERGLHEAANWAAVISRARVEANGAAERGDQLVLIRVAREVSDWTGLRTDATPESIERGLQAAALAAQADAEAGLRGAVRARPTHTGTWVALTRVIMGRAIRNRSEAAWEEAESIASAGVRLREFEAGGWAWLGTIRNEAAGSGVVLDPESWRERAAQAWERADRLTPHSPESAARLAELLAASGRLDEAGDWARLALERDEGLRLDPRRRLSETRRAGLEVLTQEQ